MNEVHRIEPKCQANKSSNIKKNEQNDILFQDFTVTFYNKYEFTSNSKRCSKEKTEEDSIYLEELENNYYTTNTISPKYYNINLIELARKQELRENKQDKSNNVLTNYNCINQINLLDDNQYVENLCIPQKTKEIPQSLNIPKNLQPKQNNFIQTHHFEKKVDSQGNKIINQYTIMKVLGRGSFGKVKLVINENDKKEYALKIANKNKLKKKLISINSNSFSMLEKEIAIMKKLDHPNIIKLFEVIDNVQNDKLYLVMEYVKKGAIFSTSYWAEELLPNNHAPSKKPPNILSESKARKYFRQLISAVYYLHNYVHVVHRDIKPENILISEDDNVKLADFGVSFLVENGANDNIKNLVGTKTYLSPEAWEGGEYEGFLSDIWACGITLYYFFHGNVPFYDQSVVKLKGKIKNDTINFKENLPEGVKDVILRCLEKEPKKRIKLVELLNHPWITDKGKEVVKLYDNNGKFHITKEDLRTAISTSMSFQTTVLIKMKMMKIKNKIKLRLLQRIKDK